MAFNNVRDPKSGMDWYTAATILEKQRQQGVNTSQIAAIPFFNNLFPANLSSIMDADPTVRSFCTGDPTVAPGFNPSWTPAQMFYALQSRTPSNPFACFAGNDWTDAQALVDTALFDNNLPTRFMQPQYGALSAWSTIGNSNYHALAVSLRQRLNSLTLDLNYSFSHSLDDSSGFQTDFGYGSQNNSGPFIENPIRQRDNYASSDFDIRQRLTFSGGWELPFARLWSSGPKRLTAGWSLYPILFAQSGIPLDVRAGLSHRSSTPGPSGAGDQGVVRADQVTRSIHTFDPHQVQTFNGTAANYYFDPNDFTVPDCFFSSAIPGSGAPGCRSSPAAR